MKKIGLNILILILILLSGLFVYKQNKSNEISDEQFIINNYKYFGKEYKYLAKNETSIKDYVGFCYRKFSHEEPVEKSVFTTSCLKIYRVFEESLEGEVNQELLRHINTYPVDKYPF